jgi:hypothetical protein
MLKKMYVLKFTVVLLKLGVATRDTHADTPKIDLPTVGPQQLRD